MLFLPSNMNFPGLNILNFRFGFATNSSSVHTLVFVSDAIQKKDMPHFAISTKGKAIYLVSQVASFLNDNNEAERFIKSTGNPALINALDDRISISTFWGCGVDFSPWWSGSFPFNYDGKTLCLEFFNDFSRIILQPDVAILDYSTYEPPDYFDEE
ncbi:MAG: hypothetical protein AB1403_16490, partial [Candidatus Riflebacteria bacterium]